MSETAIAANLAAGIIEEVDGFSSDQDRMGAESPDVIQIETPPKKKERRQRLLRGLQRISSSPSLAQIGRSRSSSSPYHGPGSFSCVSLASSPSPFGQPSAAGSYFSYSSKGGLSTAPTTPGAESPYYYDGIEEILAARKVDNAAPAGPSTTTIALPADVKPKRAFFNIWMHLPHEVKIHVLQFLQPKELVRVSRVNKEFYKMCFDGQLWTSFDASEFYQEIPAESLAKIIVAAGPFVKDLNLRGCVQVEHYKRAEVVVKACKNLINATLDGCRNFQRTTLHSLLRSNEKLANLDLTGLSAVTNTTCKIIAQSCPSLEKLDVKWCEHMDARGIKMVVEGCAMLKDLRAGEVKGFDNREVAEAIFQTNNLERLVLSGCEDLNDAALRIMMHGSNPEIDILTDRPLVPPRKLRHLDLSRCSNLTNNGVMALGHFVPELEGLQLSGCTALSDAALEPILATTPRLTHLELEDLAELSNSILSEHLAKAPCAPKLELLSVSYCENLGDTGMLPVIRNCVNLRSVDLDNTRISDLTLAEAAAMVRKRSGRTTDRTNRPRVGLNMVVYDCQHVTWTGVREVLSRNTEIKTPRADANSRPVSTYPTEVIALKCFYGWQMTVDEHTKRVLKGDLAAASRLERKWADYMQANEEAGAIGAGIRRRRRRAREAQMAHADEEEAGATATGRRRARTAACAIM
ncbi:putative f-box domain protein [Phaeoacremonium minimum UCRPA7]|uniref:Putative f-box domain protein n=1 Tax=Phaeoacremonium minimum (strain UCR-PA7) TaxID=1286976 RepID=R8BXM3_PHAM7|nr:putative f-box domain protein [Phaeoacremonium minimum UCRPA7]EOO04103.1 putative f-box domain protein [Phaeoacremonium minimum UCRPA7]